MKVYIKRDRQRHKDTFMMTLAVSNVLTNRKSEINEM